MRAITKKDRCTTFYDPSLDVRKTIPAVKTTGYDVWHVGIVNSLSNTLGVFEQYGLLKKYFWIVM